MTTNILGTNNLCDRAQAICWRLADIGMADPDIARNATVLRSMISTILIVGADQIDASATSGLGEEVTALGKSIADALDPLLTHADSCGESEMKAQLNVASILVSSIEAIARSDLLSLHQKELVSDAVLALVYPALYLVVRTIDPDKHEDDVVDNRAVHRGCNAMLLARRISDLGVSPTHARALGLTNIWNESSRE